MFLKSLLPVSALLGLVTIIQPVASATSSDSKDFFLFSISGTQNSDVQYVQVQVKSNQLIIPTDANAISVNNNSDSNSDKNNFKGQIWKNGYLSHEGSSSNTNSDDSYVVVVDKNSKQLTLKNSAKQPGAGPFSISNNALKLERSQSFVACKEKNDDYFGIYTNGYDCANGKKYNINLRTNLVGSIDTLESYEPSETESSQFNAASYTTSSSSTTHSSSASSSALSSSSSASSSSSSSFSAPSSSSSKTFSSSSSTTSKFSSSSSASSEETVKGSSSSSEEPSSFSSSRAQSSTVTSVSASTTAENTSILTLSLTSTSATSFSGSVASSTAISSTTTIEGLSEMISATQPIPTPSATSASSLGEDADVSSSTPSAPSALSSLSEASSSPSIYQSTLFSISVDSSDDYTSSVAIATTFFAGASTPRVPMIAVARHGSALGLLSSVFVGVFGSLLVLLLA